MNAREEAIKLVKKFSEVVHKYKKNVHTLMNNYDKERNLFKSKACAKIAIETIIEARPTSPLQSTYAMIYSDMVDEATEFYQAMLKELDTLTVEDIIEQ